MGKPNTLIFVDFPSPDPAASAKFYEEVFGWVVEPRPADVFYRIVPGGHFPLDDGADSPIGNLHMGIFDAANARPHPDPAGVEPREVSTNGRTARTWVLVGDDTQDRILDTAEKLGGTVLWRNHYWAEFDGNNGAFTDPWGNTFVLWSKPGAVETPAAGYTAGPKEMRWTHIALPCADIDKTIDWYTRFTSLELLDRREDADGQGAWLGHPDQGDKPFILVLVSFTRDQAKGPQPIMAPFAHIGIEVTSREEVEEIAKRGEAEGCLAWPPTDMPAPIGYICALTDPDGNMIEFSHNQGVYAKAQEVWG